MTEPAASATVLLLVPDHGVASALHAVLSRRGHRVEVVTRSSEALLRLWAGDVSLLVVDEDAAPGAAGLVRGADGRDRDDPAWPPILLLADAPRAARGGTADSAIASLAKPFSVAAFSRAVDEALGARSVVPRPRAVAATRAPATR